jgi:hypothetical protein
MTSRDKLGVGIIIGLLALLGVVLVWTFRPVGTANRGYEDNVVVQQRVINTQKSLR